MSVKATVTVSRKLRSTGLLGPTATPWHLCSASYLCQEKFLCILEASVSLRNRQDSSIYHKESIWRLNEITSEKFPVLQLTFSSVISIHLQNLVLPVSHPHPTEPASSPILVLAHCKLTKSFWALLSGFLFLRVSSQQSYPLRVGWALARQEGDLNCLHLHNPPVLFQ